MKRRLLLATAILCLFAMTAGVSSAVEGPPKKVLVLPFAMHSSENLDYLQEGIMDMLASRLTWPGKVVVMEKEIARETAEKYPGPMNENRAEAIGERLKVDYVLYGSITIFGESVSIDAKMIPIVEEKPPVTVFAQTKGMDDVIPKVNTFAENINEKMFDRKPEGAEVSEDLLAQLKLLLGQGAAEGEVPSPHFIPAGGLSEGETGAKLNPKFIQMVGAREGGIWKSQRLEVQVTGMDVGKAIKEGPDLIAITNPHTLSIYRKVGNEMKLLETVEGSINDQFVGVSMADINGNGVEEIFVSSSRKGVLNSFVVEHNGTDFVRTKESIRWYLRAFKLPGGKSILYGQSKSPKKIFSGGVYRMGYADGEYVPLVDMNLPREVNVLNFNLYDINGDGKDEVLYLTRDDRLRVVTRDGEQLWESDDYYGGGYTYLESSYEEDPARDPTLSRGAGIKPERYYIPPRILVRRLAEEGNKLEVIVNQNKDRGTRFLERLRVYWGGEVHSLSWSGLGLASNWRTQKISGTVVDYAIGDLDSDGMRELVVATLEGRPSVFTAPKSSIISFNLYRVKKEKG